MSDLILEYFDKEYNGYYPVTLNALSEESGYIVLDESLTSNRKSVLLENKTSLRVISINSNANYDIGMKIDFKVIVKSKLIWRQGIVDSFNNDFFCINVLTNYEINGSDSEIDDDIYNEESLFIRRKDLRVVNEYDISEFDLLIKTKKSIDIERVERLFKPTEIIGNVVNNNSSLFKIIKPTYIRVFDNRKFDLKNNLRNESKNYKSERNLKQILKLVVFNEETMSISA